MSGIDISIIIPVRNRKELLSTCLERFLGQDIGKECFEIVVCDDGSTEDIASVVVRFQPGPPTVRLFRQPPLGPAAARNLGIRESFAPIIVFSDSDVFPDQTMVRTLAAALNRNPEWVGAEAKIESVELKSNPLWDGPACQSGGRYHTAAIAYRRNAIIAAGGLDETFKMPACEDVDLAVHLMKKGLIGFVPEARVFHPARLRTLQTHWHWRGHWKYVMILAKRYGFLAFPGHLAGRFPRLRVALAAVLTLPGGRFIEGINCVRDNPLSGMLACLYAIFDVFCGLCALPTILFAAVPERRSYLDSGK